MKTLLVLGAIAALSSAPAFASTNLVTNGSFEDGLNGWTVVHSAGSAPVAIKYGAGGNYPDNAYGDVVPTASNPSLSPDAVGDHALYFSSDVANPDLVYQQINLVAGRTYNVGFDFYAPLNGINNPFDALVAFGLTDAGGPLAVGNVKSLTAQNWYSFATTYTANTTGPSLVGFAFAGGGTNANDYAADIVFDRVYVTESAVPEPATWAMMIGGLALVGTALRRRPTKVSFA